MKIVVKRCCRNLAIGYVSPVASERHTIMKTNTITGTYGSGRTPCNIFTAETRSGETWYVDEGSSNVNLTYQTLEDGVDIEMVDDIDTFTWSDGINSEDELEAAIEA